MRWITINATGDTKQVKCSFCGYKVTYHGDKEPKRCLCCKEVADPPKQRAGNFNKFPTID